MKPHSSRSDSYQSSGWPLCLIHDVLFFYPDLQSSISLGLLVCAHETWQTCSSYTATNACLRFYNVSPIVTNGLPKLKNGETFWIQFERLELNPAAKAKMRQISTFMLQKTVFICWSSLLTEWIASVLDAMFWNLKGYIKMVFKSESLSKMKINFSVSHIMPTLNK